MELRRDVGGIFYRVALAVAIFLGSLAVSAVLILSGMGLEWLLGLSLEDGSVPHQVVTVVLDVSLVSVAVVVSICGAIIVAGEAIISTKIYLSRLRE